MLGDRTAGDRTDARRVRIALVLSGAALVVVLVVGSALAGSVIRNRNDTWRPTNLSVTSGTRVRWHVGSGTHTVTAYGGNWTKNVTLSAGENTSRTFRSPGTYTYRCMLHSTLSGSVCNGMCGRVTVS